MKVTTVECDGKVYYLAHTSGHGFIGGTFTSVTEYETLEEAEDCVKRARLEEQEWYDRQIRRLLK